VLVVGGGDSALEAAIQLATESTATVAISYRSPEFGRCREANRTKVAQLVEAGKIRAIMASQVTSVDPDEVRLDVGGHAVHLPNDFVIVNIGGELPVEFLQKAGVSMRRFHGEALGEHKHGDGRAHLRKQASPEERALARRLALLRVLYLAAGLGVLAWLTWKGLDYYLLPKPDRLKSALHPILKPAGPWGHGVGMAATAFMLSNFLYALRKRTRALTGFGHIKGWLDFHVFVGIMSPLVIAFHAAFQSNNFMASATSLSLAVVILTGLIGRFIFGLVPAQGGKAEELEDLAGSFERLRAFAAPELAHAGARATALLDRATAPVKAGSLLAVFVRYPFEAASLRVRLVTLRGLFPDRERYLELKDTLVKLGRLRWQLRFYGSLKRLLRGWRVFHATLAVFLVFAIVAHIAVSLYLGYGLQ